MKEQLAQDCTLTLLSSGENTAPDTRLTATTQMGTSWYPSAFSIVCSHCVNSIATSLMLTWRGEQCGIFLLIFHIYLRILLFIRMESHQQKTYGRPTRLQIGSFISERKIFSEKKGTQKPTDESSISTHPIINNISLPTCSIHKSVSRYSKINS